MGRCERLAVNTQRIDNNNDILAKRSNIIPAASFDHVNIRFITVTAELQPYVQAIWYMTNEKPNLTEFTEKLYPDAGCSLTFRISDNGCTASILQHRRVVSKNWRLDANYISVVLKPGAAKALFGETIECEQCVPFSLRQQHVLHYDSFNRLCDMIAEIPFSESAQLENNVDRQLREIQYWLVNTFAQTDNTSLSWLPLIQRVNQRLLSPQQMADDATMSRRTLERYIRKYFDVTPHQLLQFSQISTARKLLIVSSNSLSDIALQCGYYDQSHFTNAFSASTLETPQQYRKRKLSQISN